MSAKRPRDNAVEVNGENGTKKPQYHRDPTTWENPTMTIKAYKNPDFLNSSHARTLRMMAEYEETAQRLAANGIQATVQFFGSARSNDREQYDAKLKKFEADLAAAPCGGSTAEAAKASIDKLKATEWMIPYMDKTRELARRLTEWSMRSTLKPMEQGVSRVKSNTKLIELKKGRKDKNGKSATYAYPPHATDASGEKMRGGLYVCTGGAGGFMEAANRGAADVPGGRSIGMGISLPFEKGLNPYVSDELAFEYHYFFTRKLCMAFHMQALVVAPGGFGTCDEMFEIMTLKQTGKMNNELPIVLLGKKHWESVINWDAFKASGTIASRDVDELLFTDSVDEAFDHITARMRPHLASPVR